MANEPFLSINDVSKQLDIPAHTLRYWEKQFPVSVKPVTGVGGRRYYRPETVAMLGQIRTLLYDRGMTIAGVKKLIKGGLSPIPVDECPRNGRGGLTNLEKENKPEKINNTSELQNWPNRRDPIEGKISHVIEILELAKAELA